MSTPFWLPSGGVAKPETPVLQRGHPLAQGLVGAWVMSEGSGTTVRDVARGNDGAFAANAPLWVPSRTGDTLQFTGGVNRHVLLPAAVPDFLDGGGTIAWSMTPAGWGEGSYGRLFDWAGCLELGIGHQNGSEDRIFYVSEFSTTDGVWHPPVGSLSLGNTYHVVLTHDRSDTTDDPVIYQNGVSLTVNETTTPSGTMSTKTGSGYVGLRTDGTTREFDGDLDYIYFWDRELTPSEIRTLYADPFQMVRPQVPVWVVGTAAAGGDLSVNVSDSVTVGESVTATMSAMLVSVSETITVGDSPTVAFGALSASVTEAVTVGESVTATISAMLVSATEAVTVGESVTVTISAMLVSVSEAVTVGEAVTVSIPDPDTLTTSAVAAVTVGESVTVAISAMLVSVSEAITIGESATVDIGDITVSVSEAITVGESVTTLWSDPQVSVVEAVTVGESVSTTGLGLDLSVSVSEAITVGESSIAALLFRVAADRVYAVVSESREHAIANEDRTYSIG